MAAVYKELDDGNGVPVTLLAHAMRLLGMNPTNQKVASLQVGSHLEEGRFKDLMEERLEKLLFIGA